ncbi:hypothetical protein [Acetobacterium carbinolicum]|uniref:hypothetical protein n=1 Tax=Acetobacterium carbinolicum TaxID=52690 RepID=UPI0039C8CB22
MDGATGYQVYYGTSEADISTVWGTTTTTSIDITSLSSGSYYFKIIAFDNFGKSAATVSAAVTISH